MSRDHFLPFKHILAKYQKSIFYFIFLNHCQCWYTMQLQVHQETDLTKNCWHRTWRSSVKLIKQLESSDMQAFYFVRLLALSGISCFLKFWVENVSCLCAILGGGSGDKTKTDTGCVGLVKAAWLNLSRAVQQMADFGAWRRCSSFSLSLQLQSHSGQRRHRRRQDAHVFWSVPSPKTSAEEKFARADLLKFDGSLQRLTGACWVKCGQLLVVRYCCREFCAVASWRNWDGYS